MSVRPYKGIMPKIAKGAYIDEQAGVIGDVVVGEDSSFWPMAVARGDVHHISIGARTNIQDGAVLHVTHDSHYVPGGKPLTIGDDVTVGHGVILHACTIGNRCLIGMHTTVLDGVIIEDDVIIGANSLVSPGKRLESGYLYVGSPAKAVRPLTENELSFLKYSAEHYVELAKDYLINTK